jgi:short-subunit dehydrogenase
LSRVLVTGASAGLGLELARLFAADGHDLVLTARNAEALESLAAALRADFEVSVLCVPGDLTDPGAVTALLEAVEKEKVKVGVLVNNAGFGAYGPFTGRPWETYQSLIDLNITALARLTHALLPGITQAAAQSGPTAGKSPVFGVMNVASTAAFQPGPLMAAYFASKAFVLSFTEALHEELRGTGVKVSVFCPGPTRTGFFTVDPMIPAGVITDEDLAEYNRRDAKRMDPGLAARVGYEGFLSGKAIVIPGRQNRVQAWWATRLPRGLIRRVTHRLLTK